MRAPPVPPHSRPKVTSRHPPGQSQMIGEPMEWRFVMTEAFKDRKLIVVGGSSGMGRQTAADVVAGGGSAVIVGRDQGKVDEAVMSLSANGKVWGIAADLADRMQVAGVQQQLAAEHAD